MKSIIIGVLIIAVVVYLLMGKHEDDGNDPPYSTRRDAGK